MKWFTVALFAALTAAPIVGSAQRIVPISPIPRVDDKTPHSWGIGGFDLINFKANDSQFNPFERVELADARLVEIFSRAQVPPLKVEDVRAEMHGGKTIITVRNYLLLEVDPKDAKADGKSVSDEAGTWVSALRKAILPLAPKPSLLGI